VQKRGRPAERVCKNERDVRSTEYQDKKKNQEEGTLEERGSENPRRPAKEGLGLSKKSADRIKTEKTWKNARYIHGKKVPIGGGKMTRKEDTGGKKLWPKKISWERG